MRIVILDVIQRHTNEKKIYGWRIVLRVEPCMWKVLLDTSAWQIHNCATWVSFVRIRGTFGEHKSDNIPICKCSFSHLIKLKCVWVKSSLTKHDLIIEHFPIFFSSINQIEQFLCHCRPIKVLWMLKATKLSDFCVIVGL